jgi:UPF0755 protein
MLFVIVLSFAGLVGAALAVLGPGPGTSDQSPTTVILRRGDGVLAIGRDLARARVVRSALVFAVAAEVTGAAPRLKAGEYAFAPKITLIQVLHILRDGLVVRHFVTLPEGLTSRAAAEILEQSDVLTGPAPVAPEGALLPETYEVSRGESRAAVIARMERDRDALVAKLWTTRPPGLPYKRPEDAVILASVVEKETALPAERPLVAGVFVNRLEKGMRLESDPTVVYGLTGGASLGHGLTRSELAAPTPYNTYRVGGLPPTPIDNPGRASLVAALAPTLTDNLYFVANGAGGHAFSPTLAQHTQNVANWRRLEHSKALSVNR